MSFKDDLSSLGQPSHRFRRVIFISKRVGSIALALSLVGAFTDTKTFFQSYLFSFLFWSDLPLGALPLLMTYALTGGQWGASTRRILEALSDTILLMALFSIPIFIGMSWIYPWMDPGVAALSKVLHKHAYLNPITFTIRALIYFGSWIGLNSLIQNHSETSYSQESTKTYQLRKLSAGGLVLVGYTASFASVDWQMSVEPSWYSTIYGMVYIIGQSLSSYSFTLIIFGLLVYDKNSSQVFPNKVLRDLGNILLTLVMTWAYLSFMQYLIVWSGNLPHEVIWYNHRTQGGWQWLALLLVLFQFSIPFILLLFRPMKDKPNHLAVIGLIVFVIRSIDHYWMLMPGLFVRGFTIPWEAVTTWLGIGGIWFAMFLKRLIARPFFAKNDLDWPHSVQDASAASAMKPSINEAPNHA